MASLKSDNTAIKTTLFIFDKNGSYISYDAYNKYLRENELRILDKEKVTTHILRHTHTSLLAAQGVDIETISRRLGHDGSALTKQIYLHVT